MNTRIYVGPAPDEDNETTSIPHNAVDLTGLLDGYGVTQINGLARPKAQINRSVLAGANASRISGAQISERNITLSVVPQGDGEEMRQALYSILPFNTMLRFYVKTANRQVFIDGYVEDMGGEEPNGEEYIATVSVLCPFPWFQSVELHQPKLVVGENTLPYDGDVAAGFTLSVPAQLSPPLQGSVGDLTLTIGGKTFAYSGNISVPKICTIPGRKKFLGIRSTAGSNMAPAFSALAANSEWVTISRGNTTLTVSCSENTVDWFNQQNVFTYRDTYSGV